MTDYTERIDTLSAQLQQANRDYAEAKARQDYLTMANIRETQDTLIRELSGVKLAQQRDQAQAVKDRIQELQDERLAEERRKAEIKDRIDVLRARREGGGA